MKDKTEIDANSEGQDLYKLLFENHPIPLIVFQRDTLKIISANGAAAKFYGYSIDELLKLTILDIRPEEEREKFLEYHKPINLNNPKAGIWKHKKKNGTIAYVDVTASDINFNNITARIISLTDVTKTVESQEALREEEVKYQTLVESVSEGIVMADNDDVIKFVNKRYCEMLGYSKEELVGKVGYKILLDEDMQDVIKKKNLDRIKGITDRYSLKMKKKDGSPIFLEVSGTPVYDKSGNIIGSLGIHSDVTERQEAIETMKESEEKFRSLVENSIVGVYLIQDEVFKYLNPKLAEIFGYRVDELLYKLGPKDVTPPDDWKVVNENLSKRLKGEVDSLHYTFRGQKKDGKLIYVEVFGSRTTYLGRPAVIGILLDITSRKEAEMEIVAEKKKAEEANRLKTAFLSTVSHELRSPLNAILGFSSILKETYYENGSEEEKQFFEAMDEAGARLLDTITQVLDISRLEADDFSLNLKPVSINEAIESAYQVLYLQAKKKNLNFELKLPEKEIIITSDEYCFGGVLVNLISNAIKYSNKGTISVSLTETEDSVVCAVKDEGVGMSEEYQKHLFQTFSQEDLGLSRRYEGAGLGLAITKRYLDLLGGNIKVQSKKGVGTTMIFSVPKST